MHFWLVVKCDLNLRAQVSFIGRGESQQEIKRNMTSSQRWDLNVGLPWGQELWEGPNKDRHPYPSLHILRATERSYCTKGLADGNCPRSAVASIFMNENYCVCSARNNKYRWKEWWPRSGGRRMWIIKNRILILELFDIHISWFFFNKAALLLKWPVCLL